MCHHIEKCVGTPMLENCAGSPLLKNCSIILENCAGTPIPYTTTLLVPVNMPNCALKPPLYSNFALPWQCEIMKYSSIVDSSITMT